VVRGVAGRSAGVNVRDEKYAPYHLCAWRLGHGSYGYDFSRWQASILLFARFIIDVGISSVNRRTKQAKFVMISALLTEIDSFVGNFIH
jgi:hypothetical protein